MPAADTPPLRMLQCWRGLGLSNWIRLLAMRPPLNRLGVTGTASLTITAALNSMMHGLERLVYGRGIHKVVLHEAPVFILGHWRSGTTLLHNLLALDPQFAFVNLYQSLFPGHFLLSERWMTALTSRFLPATRPMDQMPCAWNLAEEDEIPLMLLTLQSPYLSIAFPNDRVRREQCEHLPQALADRELKHWKRIFLHFLQKVIYKQPGKRLLLKSPAHTSRIPLLLQMFPQARFIYLVRNPFEVFASTVRLHQAMWDVNGLTHQPPEGIEEHVLEAYMKMYHAYHLHRALLQPSQFVELRYEDLVEDPVQSLQRVYEGLSLSGFEEQRSRIVAQLPTHRAYRTSTAALSTDDQERVYERWAPAFRRYGYDGPTGPSRA